MSNLSTAKFIHFASERERKTYEVGMAQVAEKMKGHIRPTAQEIEAASIARGRAEILKKFGSAFYAKTFGTPPPRAMAAPAKPAASGAPKHFAKEVGPFQPTKMHHYVCRQWLPALA